MTWLAPCRCTQVRPSIRAIRCRWLINGRRTSAGGASTALLNSDAAPFVERLKSCANRPTALNEKSRDHSRLFRFYIQMALMPDLINAEKIVIVKIEYPKL